MNFAEAVKNESKKTYTENGATAFNTSSNALVDLFSTIGALRNADYERITRLFSEAYEEDKLIATKILFYARDIRGGLGERKTFRTIIKYMAKYMPEALRPNIKYIGVFGRYDDLYELIGTPLEDDMWAFMREQLMADLAAMSESKSVSLLAKWVKTADASSKKTRTLGIYTAKKLNVTVYDYKRSVRLLRKYIDVTERKMSAREWDKIDYESVPSRAMMIYRNAFTRHDADGFSAFINKAVNGKVKINSATLFPYDIVEKYLYGVEHNSDVLEAQWRQLPDYVDKDSHVLVMADTSGSMYGRPMATALGLAIYFAERNAGAYKDIFMSFSSRPKFHTIKGNTLVEKLHSLDRSGWEGNTNLEAAFDMVLDTAIKNHVSKEDMPKAILVVSDMEIDMCVSSHWSFYDEMRERYEKNGYDIPTVIFWNVDSRHDVFHADADRKGVQLVSGQSAVVFKQMMSRINMTAYEAMMAVINNGTYDCITVE